jgi:hypothetical protein
MRVLYPDHFQANIPGIRIFHETANNFQPREDFSGYKVFIWQRPFLDYPLNLTEAIAQQKNLLNAGYLTLIELDDDPLAWSKKIKHQFFTLLNICHGIQTSTEVLANDFRQFSPHVAVFPNQLAFLPPPPSIQEKDFITLFFGAQNRQSDWQVILPYLNKLISIYQNKLRFSVLHDKKFFEALETEYKTFKTWCNYSVYLEILNQGDIALLPLEFTRFNARKSDLKFLECAACGVVSLASPTVYEQSIKDGETGLIYHSPSDFFQKLNRLIQDSQLRQKLANNAYNWVKNNRMLSQHYQQRYQWYQKMCEQLFELNQDLSEKNPDLFNYY